jgi:3-phenylpropionate/trans-cinnamate dioxygenase ferredoxin reductase component
MSGLRRIAIVGASVGGLTTAESLRRHGFDGVISLIGDEVHLPYDRPPLSKQVLSGKWTADRASLRRAGDIAALELDLRTGTKAIGLRPGLRQVELDGGRAVECDAAVIATGLRPRQLPMLHGLAGVHVVRTIDDALALRDAVLEAERLIVVGAGFLGTEIAATIREIGPEVTLVDLVREPVALQLGQEMGRLVAQLHRDHGVDVRMGVGVAEPIADNSRVRGLMLTDGSRVPADLVVTAVGSVPATQWLHGAGLDLTDGLVCDAMCRASPGVYAVGDVARWPHANVGRHIRIEQRTNAAEQAQAVARNLLAGSGARPYAPLNFAWTDQYDVKIQMYGHRRTDATFALIEGSPRDGRFVGAYLEGGLVTAVVGWNSPKSLLRHRELVRAAAAA